MSARGPARFPYRKPCRGRACFGLTESCQFSSRLLRPVRGGDALNKRPDKYPCAANPWIAPIIIVFALASTPGQVA
jgi:hypothetical protein